MKTPTDDIDYLLAQVGYLERDYRELSERLTSIESHEWIEDSDIEERLDRVERLLSFMVLRNFGVESEFEDE